MFVQITLLCNLHPDMIVEDVKGAAMGLFLDSAIIEEIEESMGLGYVAGVTTNPLLMKNTEGSWRDALKKICGISKGPVLDFRKL